MKKRRGIFNAILLVFASGNLLFSSNLRQISNVDNLSNNSINCFCQDESGKLWIGTCDGLNMYNGKTVEIYQPVNIKKVLSGSFINNVIETEKDIFWIQTRDRLNYLDRNTGYVKYYNEFNVRLHMAKDNNNTLFIIQNNNLIQYFDKKQEVFKAVSVSGIIVDNILLFTIDNNNTLWLFFKNGLIKSYNIKYTDNSVSFETRYEVQHEMPLMHCFISDGDIIFVDSLYDLYTYDLRTKITTFRTNLKEMVKERGEITSIINNDNNFFIGYKTNGVQALIKRNGFYGYEIKNIPINCGVFSLLKDKNQDIVWIGTDGQGVYMYSNDRYTLKSVLMQEYMPYIGKPVRSIFKDKENTLWVGTKGDGLIQIYNYDESIDLSKAKINRITASNSQLADNSVYCTTVSKKNILWIGTENGLNYYSYRDRKIWKVNIADKSKPIIYIHDVYEQDSVIWLATVGMGIVKADLSWHDDIPVLNNVRRLTIDNEEIDSNYFFKIFPKNDTIWFANRGRGVFKVNPETMEYEILKFSTQENDKMLDEILTITEINNCMYFATGGGLIEYKSKDDFKILDNSYGFPNNTIHSILKDDDNNSIWLSTNRGVINYYPQQNAFRDYGFNDGLKVVEFSDGAYFKDDEKDIIYLGGVNGFLSVSENEAYSNKEYMPPLTFDGLTILGIKENINDYLDVADGRTLLKLKNVQNFISVEFNAIDFVDANSYSFFYKIEGINNQWIDNGNSNVVSLTNIAPGNYKLCVKYINRVTNKESTEYTLSITILPPWYLTNTAYLIYLCIVIALLILLVRYLEHINQKKGRNLLRKLEDQHQKEVYEAKLGFFTNIAHEFCTPLTLIYGPCNQILKQNVSLDIKKYTQVILRNAERLNTLIQDLIDFRKIETENKPPVIVDIDIVPMINDIAISFKEFADSNNAHFYKLLPNTLRWNSDRNYIMTIVTNLISNAFKYMSENGHVEIEVKKENNQLVIIVSNTGKGIEEQHLEDVFNKHLILDALESHDSTKTWSRNGLGLAILKSMVENLNGTISIDSTPNEWTHFIVTLPWLEATTGIIIDQNVPRAVAPVTMNNNIQKHESQLWPQRIDKNKRTILAIDDDIDILWFISDIFTDEYNVITLSSSLEVKDVLEKIYPDIILCDINIPQLSGIDLIRIIKADKQTSHIPLIIISAKQNTEDLADGMDAGAELYITKPFDVEYLKISVKKLIDRQSDLKEYFSSPLSAFELNDGNLVHNEDNKFVKDIQRIIDKNIHNNKLNADFIAHELNINIRNMYRKLGDIGSESVGDMIRNSRLYLAENLLLKSKKTINEIVFETGFGNRVSFHKAFVKKHGCSPSDYRKKMKI